MKVVLFCGGLGLRMREPSASVPKPMVEIGYRPILWHIMKYYAHFGHKDFILCLGWHANIIKDYFLNYDECRSNDFTLSNSGRTVEVLNKDIDDWNITCIDTGKTSCIGERLRRIQEYVRDEEHFLANYTDGLTNLDLNLLIERHLNNGSTATFISVPPSQSFHSVLMDECGRVNSICAIANSNVWMNGGYFVFSNEIFDYIHRNEELVEEPFSRLITETKISSLRFSGFWSCVDTYKELSVLRDSYDNGIRPWAVWEQSKK